MSQITVVYTLTYPLDYLSNPLPYPIITSTLSPCVKLEAHQDYKVNTPPLTSFCTTLKINFFAVICVHLYMVAMDCLLPVVIPRTQNIFLANPSSWVSSIFK